MAIHRQRIAPDPGVDPNARGPLRPQQEDRGMIETRKTMATR
ncbi:hypothetical protein [Sphingomonas sp. PvP056]